jgi:hypothetical protein
MPIEGCGSQSHVMINGRRHIRRPGDVSRCLPCDGNPTVEVGQAMGLFTLKRGDPTRQWVRAAAAAARQIADNRPAHRARRRIHTKPGNACCALCSAGPPSRARALLDKALGLSLAARSTRSVTLCLAALARWALVAGDPRAGSAGGGGGRGLRRRAGLRVWPMLRQGEADPVAQVRQARRRPFRPVFATGTRLPSGTR